MSSTRLPVHFNKFRTGVASTWDNHPDIMKMYLKLHSGNPSSLPLILLMESQIQVPQVLQVTRIPPLGSLK